MKLVIDTNVVISGIYFGGLPRKLLETISKDKYQIILSENIIYEYFDVNQRMSAKRNAPDTSATKILNTLISKAQIIDPGNIKTPECDDLDDIKFLQAAIAGKAKFLISGDKHLLNVGKYKRGKIIKAAAFMSFK